MVTPFPTQVIKTTSTASKFGFFGIIKFLYHHWYIISIIFFLLPSIISSIHIAKETNNPVYPFISTGLTIINADSQLDKDVNKIRENPIELIGTKPEEGLWNKTKYYWNLILLYWSIIGYLFLISVPFKLAYSYYKYKGDRGGYESSVWENTRRSLIAGFVFIFAVNLILTIIGAFDGTLVLSFPNDADVYKKSLIVVKNTLPFHGVYNLITYWITQFNI